MKRTLFIGLLALGCLVQADTASTINEISAHIPDTGIVVSICAAILEFALRFCKTSKPASLFYGVASIIKAVGSLFIKVGMLLDNVLQNVKPAQFEEVTKATDEQSA